MFATDFIFDSQRLSDYDCIICSFDGEVSSSGAEIEYNVVKAPNKNKYNFYGAQFNEVITWEFSICKNPCGNDNEYFDQYEESMLSKWLLKLDNYKWFQFDQEGYEDLFYMVTINMFPHQIAGRTVGFDLTVTSNCAYGFTDLIFKKAIINASTPLKFVVNNDLNVCEYPEMIITGQGDFYISNDSDKSQNVILDKASEFTNVSTPIVMDSDNEIITGIASPDDFNWYFLRLVDGENILSTNSVYDVNIEFKYREARRVIV